MPIVSDTKTPVFITTALTQCQALTTLEAVIFAVSPAPPTKPRLN